MLETFLCCVRSLTVAVSVGRAGSSSAWTVWWCGATKAKDTYSNYQQSEASLMMYNVLFTHAGVKTIILILCAD